LATETEIRRQLRQTDQNLFDTFKALQATGVPISIIAQQLGCNRRRLDKWVKQDQLPARQKRHPAPGSAETFREYLRQRWDAGYRNGRLLFDEIRARGYEGTHKTLNKLVSPWRLGNVAFEQAANDRTIPPPPPVLTDPTERQISPQIAAVLLSTAARTDRAQRADCRRTESRLSGLRAHAILDDGLSRRAQTVPTKDDGAASDTHRHGAAPVDGSSARQRYRADPALRVAAAAGHPRGGGGGDRPLEQRAG
jgi:hypothetical protein